MVDPVLKKLQDRIKITRKHTNTTVERERNEKWRSETGEGKRKTNHHGLSITQKKTKKTCMPSVAKTMQDPLKLIEPF